ncbi:MAG: prolyl oligopeptidase family serine peptidase [Ignavibacteriales bacterium]|nr:prolyl oligopeptidase family serine peptidase [Ignavibacteriales bacterium]
MTHSKIFRKIIFIFFFLINFIFAQTSDTLILRQGMALQLLRGYGETIIAPNPVEANLALGKWESPSKGESVTFVNGEEHQWIMLNADSSGWFEDSVLTGCYLYFSVEMKKKTIMILEAMGNEMVYINGVPRSGNPYGLKDTYESWETNFQYSRLPLQLEKGKNEFLFRCQRGRFKAKLYNPSKNIMFNTRDITIPDFIVGEKIDTWGSVVIVNASDKTLNNLKIKTTIEKKEGKSIQVPIIQPMSVRKVGFPLISEAINQKGVTDVCVTLFETHSGKNIIIDTVNIPLRVLNFSDNHKETFISKIDGSVQYYGINPAVGSNKEKFTALFLSLHGAGVDAVNQSGSYYPKTWGHIVAPTNRRPYGYNWEEWGRLDAMETMEIVKQRYRIDENRIYLTGHSMGGHGVWHIGSLFPDKFAAIGPSAGWISFWTYRFRGQNVLDTTDIRKMIRRATTPSETFMHVDNYKQLGAYILHGSDDDNVYPEQARMMVDELNKHNYKDFIYHEQKGVGHWWDLSDEPGADCVDWAPMFDFFARHARPQKERIREINFKTSNPGVSSKNNWITIDAQIEQLKISSANIRFDPGMNRFVGTTDNIARLAFDLDMVKTTDTLIIELDSQKVVTAGVKSDDGKMWISKKGGQWIIDGKPSLLEKGAHRYGAFKEAFRNQMIFVYGTDGTQEENEWAFNKARYDAEKFWYQGNGSIDIYADKDFDPSKFSDRNIVLYGNRNTNKAWGKLLSDSPVQVGKGFVKIGEKKISENDLCCIFIRPRAGSNIASVAAISGTGIIGMKLSNRLPYMNPGIGLPDCTIMNQDILSHGEEGVVMAGFFGLDWSLEKGDFVWNKKR